MKLPNLDYHLARVHARIARRLYQTFLPVIVRRRIKSPRPVDLDVFAYSNEASMPEQVASIRSFLRHVGRPRHFVVVSDGTHSESSIRLLHAIDPAVMVEQPAPAADALPGSFDRYLQEHPTGKQLRLIMNLPRDIPALYTDSDVLFFPGAAVGLLQLLQRHEVPAYYLADCQFAGDERLLRDEAERRDSVNTGVLLLFRTLDWSLSISRFAELKGSPTFFTNQTMTHLTMHRNAARPLDPKKYVLQLDDQFLFRDRYADAGLALRHYVNPVRHKFWTRVI